jgi:hypothetical protein
MRWFLQVPPHALWLYIGYCAIAFGYTAFAVGAAASSDSHRARIHRGSVLHLVEGWAFVAVAWAALAWSHYYLVVHTWPHVAPTPAAPWVLSVAAIGVWVLRPLAILTPILMVVTTLVHLRQQPAEWSGHPRSAQSVPPPPPPSAPGTARPA